MPKTLKQLNIEPARISGGKLAVGYDKVTYKEMLLSSHSGRFEENSEVQVFHLYEVTRPDCVVMVLAESEDAAASQGSCYPHLEQGNSWDLQEQRRSQSTVRRVPLVIRGWGGVEF